MKITDDINTNDNWHEITWLWNIVVNWGYYELSDSELKRNIKALIIFIWSEKELLKLEYEGHSKTIDTCIKNSKYLSISLDLANMIKHRKLLRKRWSDFSIPDVNGKISFGHNKTRNKYYIQKADGTIIEIFEILRGSIEELKKIRIDICKCNLKSGVRS